MKRRFHDLRWRATLAIGGSVAAAVVALRAPSMVVGIIVAVAAVIAYSELERLVSAKPLRVRVVSASLPALVGLVLPAARGVLAWVGVAAVVCFAMLLVSGRARVGLSPLLRYVEGAVLPASLVGLHASGPPGPALTVFGILVPWSCDIGGYLAGRLIGGRRLAPAVSHRKTIAGSLGGLVLGGLAGLAVVRWLPLAWAAGFTLCIALSAAGLAQVGDLYESALKRAAGARRSGAMLGAEGGMLDVLDSVSFVAPVLYVVVVIGG